MSTKLLDEATSLLGPLVPEYRAAIQSYLDNPTADGWNQVYSIVINGRSLRRGTIWQAVMAVDPTFPREKAPRSPWPRIPDALTVARGIRLVLSDRSLS